MGDGHEAGTRGEPGRDCVEIQFSGFGHRTGNDSGSRGGGHQLPGHEIGVVLHLGDQNLVTRREAGAAEALGHEVDRAVVPP